MTRYRKQDFPVSDIRRFLEPGPIVLVSSVWRGERNIMRTIHHRGDGVFMISGTNTAKYRRLFKAETL